MWGKNVTASWPFCAGKLSKTPYFFIKWDVLWILYLIIIVWWCWPLNKASPLLLGTLLSLNFVILGYVEGFVMEIWMIMYFIFSTALLPAQKNEDKGINLSLPSQHVFMVSMTSRQPIEASQLDQWHITQIWQGFQKPCVRRATETNLVVQPFYQSTSLMITKFHIWCWTLRDTFFSLMSLIHHQGKQNQEQRLFQNWFLIWIPWAALKVPDAFRIFLMTWVIHSYLLVSGPYPWQWH